MRFDSQPLASCRSQLPKLRLHEETLHRPAAHVGTALASEHALPQPALPVRVFLDTVEAEVVYAGTAPGAVAGLLQVNIKIPHKAPTGASVPIPEWSCVFPPASERY